MKSFHIIFSFLLCTPLFFSCEEVVDLKVPETSPQLVVDGSISNRTGLHTVKLSWSTAYFEETDPPAIEDAEVILHDDQGRQEILQHEPGGRYVTETPGVIGNTYWITIRLTDGRAYQSLPEELHPVAPVLGVKVIREDEDEEPDEEGKVGYSVLLDADEPGEEVNFYRWKIYVNDTLESKADDLSFARDDFVNEEVRDVEIFADLMRQGDRVRVEQLSITERYYDFLTVLFQQTVFVGGLFDPPPAPIVGNVVNSKDENVRALGYFYASAIEEGETVIE